MLRENARGKENRKEIAAGEANKPTPDTSQPNPSPFVLRRGDVTFKREVSCLCSS